MSYEGVNVQTVALKFVKLKKITLYLKKTKKVPQLFIISVGSTKEFSICMHICQLFNNLTNGNFDNTWVLKKC